MLIKSNMIGLMTGTHVARKKTKALLVKILKFDPDDDTHYDSMQLGSDSCLYNKSIFTHFICTKYELLLA